MNSLRTRLLLSYVLIIVVTLAVIGLALVLFLYSRPLPILNAYQRLADVAQGAAGRAAGQGGPQERLTPEQAEQTVRSLAESTELRILIVDRGPDGEPRVAFDSLGRLPLGEEVQNYRIDPQRSRPSRTFGAFADPEDGDWLFVGVPSVLGRLRLGQVEEQRLILFAAPAPRLTLGAVFTWFGENLLTPILQAGCVGLVVAVMLAVLIARSVARPLQRMARAAGAVASGDFDQQVDEAGPDEVRTVARSFNHMTRQVKAGQQAQRDFLANVSHDLRTPLTSIQGFSQAILDGTAAPPEGARRAATVIHDEASRLARMVEELLDLARIESGQLLMMRQVINPAEILRAMGDRLALRAQEQGITVRSQMPDLPDVVGDGDRLAQVFTNLIDNALKHSRTGGVVTLGGARAGDGLEFTVADTGEGIPQEKLARIFERFYQVDKSRRRDARRSGVGLGLAISREIVEAHGGTIRAESVEGVGTRFVVWLPLPRPTDVTVARRRR
jgi:two-component system OmpR family sensor kinase